MANRAPVSYSAIRDRTAEFKKIREEERRARSFTQPPVDEATVSLVSAALATSSSDATPQWMLKTEKIRADMTILKERLGKLRENQAKALLVSFESDNDAASSAEALTSEIKQMFKKLEVEITSLDKGATSNDDAKVMMQVRTQLAQALYTLSNSFRKDQMRFLNKIEQQKGLEQGSSLGLIGGDVDGDGLDSGFTQSQIAMVDNTSALIAERDTEIQKIVQSIGELAQIMKDLHTLVVEQGTILDRIDRNIQETSIKVEEGVKVLKQAEKTQKQGRMMICIIALIVIIVIMLIIVIIRHA